MQRVRSFVVAEPLFGMQAAKKLRLASRMAQAKLDSSVSASRDLTVSIRNLVFLIRHNGWAFTGLMALLLYCLTILVCTLIALPLDLQYSLDGVRDAPSHLTRYAAEICAIHMLATCQRGTVTRIDLCCVSSLSCPGHHQSGCMSCCCAHLGVTAQPMSSVVRSSDLWMKRDTFLTVHPPGHTAEDRAEPFLYVGAQIFNYTRDHDVIRPSAANRRLWVREIDWFVSRCLPKPPPVTMID